MRNQRSLRRAAAGLVLLVVVCLTVCRAAGAEEGPAPIPTGGRLVPAILELRPDPPPPAGDGPAGEGAPPPAQQFGGTQEGTPPEEAPSPWLRVPPVRTFPRLGAFWIAPTGPGYYSALDVLTGHARTAPPRFPYPPNSAIAFSFFDADFRYLENPDNPQRDLFDPLKRIHLGDNWLLSLGGDVRWRHVQERDSRLSGQDNTFDLYRTRLFADLWYRDAFRAYVEYLDAHSFNQDLAPLAIDVDRSDLLNAFVDVKLFDQGGDPAYLRVGRQELLYGSERLISPLDWANTRRTFQGVKAFRQGEKFDVDLFWVQPVIQDPSNFDSVDNDQNLAGLWTTYRPQPGRFLDLYYLFLDNTTPDAGPAFNVSTLGARYAGDHQSRLMWDVEAMYQFGDRGSQDISAGAFTAGAGYRFADVPWVPQFWVYYDWASGDDNPGVGKTFSTFNQIFPFGHYYLGFLDQVARQNIQDVNVHFGIYPTKWILLWAQYHHFELDSPREALFNAAGATLRRDATGRAGRQVGDEIDLLVNFHLGPHSDVFVGWSKLFAGDFIQRTGSPRSPELFYVQYSFRW